MDLFLAQLNALVLKDELLRLSVVCRLSVVINLHGPFENSRGYISHPMIMKLCQHVKLTDF